MHFITKQSKHQGKVTCLIGIHNKDEGVKVLFAQIGSEKYK